MENTAIHEVNKFYVTIDLAKFFGHLSFIEDALNSR